MNMMYPKLLQNIILFYVLTCSLTDAFLGPLNCRSHLQASTASKAPLLHCEGYESSAVFGKKNVNIDEEDTKEFSMIENFKSKPGTLIILPFVAIFFVDIVANILVITKRTIEYAITGEYTVWHF
mmetsp:Transcript_18930/g.21928  ORF Transcript_18930/g.21928 Transcript_18930/m.21928 type:complete len:125 (+) Transcript_18930:127-501(+)